MDVAILFLIFFILLMLSVPIGYAIGIATLITLISFSSIPITMIAQKCCSRSRFISFISNSFLYVSWKFNE